MRNDVVNFKIFEHELRPKRGHKEVKLPKIANSEKKEFKPMRNRKGLPKSSSLAFDADEREKQRKAPLMDGGVSSDLMLRNIKDLIIGKGIRGK